MWSVFIVFVAVILALVMCCIRNYRSYNEKENELSNKLDIMLYDPSNVSPEEIRNVEMAYNLEAVYDDESGKLLGFMHRL
jgi:hypothetical protein